MAKKSFKESIGKDFAKKVDLDEKPEKAARTKAFPGARLIPITEIYPDPEQPRKIFNKEKFDDLLASVKSKGVLEPLNVKIFQKGYKIIIGERRFRAAKEAGLTELPCIIKEISDTEVLECQLIENLQRENLKPVEEAQAFKRLSSTKTQEEIAKLIGKSQPYVSQSMKILKLPAKILEESQQIDTPKEVLLHLVESENPEELWINARDGTAKEIKKKIMKPKKGRPKLKPWTWEPENREFVVTIRFKKQNYKQDTVIKALEHILNTLKNYSSERKIDAKRIG